MPEDLVEEIRRVVEWRDETSRPGQQLLEAERNIAGIVRQIKEMART